MQPQGLLRRPGGVALALVGGVMLWTSNAAAQERSVGGHVGVALPLVWRSEDKTTTMAEEFAISVPVGVILRKNTGLPIDIGVAPTLLHNGRVTFSASVNAVRGIGRGFSAVMGVLVDVSDPAWGFAATLDKVLLRMQGGAVLVGDLSVPVLFYTDSQGAGYTSVGLAMHVGVAF